MGHKTEEKIKKNLEKNSKEDVTELENIVTHFKHHSKIAKSQKEKFKQMKSGEYLSKHEGTIVILMDFKENLKLNQGGREVDMDFYQVTQRTLLGFVCYYFEKDVVVKRHFDVISKSLDHSTNFVISACEELFKQPWFKFKHAECWADCGPHFRSFQMMYYFLQEKSKFVKIRSNYFAEKHGKSPADSHFSMISRHKKEYESRERIQTSEELISVLKAKIQISNSLKVKKDPKAPAKVYQFHIMDTPDLKICPFVLNFKNIQSYYSFEKNGDQLLVGILTGNKMNNKEYFEDNLKKKDKEEKRAPEIKPVQQNYGPNQLLKFERQMKELKSLKENDITDPNQNQKSKKKIKNQKNK